MFPQRFGKPKTCGSKNSMEGAHLVPSIDVSKGANPETKNNLLN